MPTPGVDFFRVDRSGATRKLLVIAGLLVLVGSTAIGAHLVNRLGPSLAHAVTLGGGLTVVSGLILGFGTMAMIVFENVYLVLEEDGLRYHENGKDTVIPWAELAAVKVEGTTGWVRFERKEGAPLRWLAGRTAKDLVVKVDESKRKALHGLLKPAD